MKILVTGQCSLHWGRMEYGNIGNYYIVEPLFRLFHEVFPGATVRTTFQMSEEFCVRENVSVIPLENFYSWRKNEREIVERELISSEEFLSKGTYEYESDYIREVLAADLIVNFSGDMWGENADLFGKDRFYVGLLKDLIAMNFGKKVVMVAGSPGPFSDGKLYELAKRVYSGYSFVSNREEYSTLLLKELGFDVSRTLTLACPAFLFQPANKEVVSDVLNRDVPMSLRNSRPTVGVVICGWNFEVAPFDRWPREDREYSNFVAAIEHIISSTSANVCLMSHSNGFEPNAEVFSLKHGRDYPVIKQLERILKERGHSERVYSLDSVYDAWTTKGIIGTFDMLVSGRVHAAVAGLSQGIPTVVVDYGHEPKAHKLKGFARVAGVEEYVADPGCITDLISKVDGCWRKKDEIARHLRGVMPQVLGLAKDNVRLLKDVEWEKPSQ